jgi:CO/xanthine dehydrogenase Mo-binding subunit
MASDMPTLGAVIVEKIDSDIPLGTKGAGEVAMGCAAPAIANAIYNAIGVRTKELPITPAKVLQALKEKAAEY